MNLQISCLCTYSRVRMFSLLNNGPEWVPRDELVMILTIFFWETNMLLTYVLGPYPQKMMPYLMWLNTSEKYSVRRAGMVILGWILARIPVIRDTFPLTWRMWDFHESLSSITSPKNLVSLFLWIFPLNIFKGGRLSADLLPEKNRYTDLFTFKLSLLADIQVSMFLSSRFSWWRSVVEFESLMNTEVSSANRLKWRRDEALHISFMNTRNSNGEREEPCGVPTLTSRVSDAHPFTLTHCFLLQRKFFMRRRLAPRTP